MNFLKNGTKVKIADGDIVGTIISVSIDGIEPKVNLMYKISWWCGGSRNTDWLFDYEVEEYIETKKKAGLVDYEANPEKLIEC